MSEWKTYNLGDLLELVIDHRGKTPKKLGFDDFHNTGYPVLSARHVKTSGLINTEQMRFANEEMYKKWMKIPVQKGDVILTSEAPLGELFYIDGSQEYLLGQRVFGLRPKAEVVNPLYLFAWLSSQQGQATLHAKATGSTVQGIKQSELLKIELPLPDLKYQEFVANVLFSLNHKIQLNTQTNQTLEAIAQAIFKSWFVDFDPVRAKAQAISDGKTSDEANLSAMAVISGKALEDLTQTEYQQLWEIADAFPSELVENAEFGEVPKGWKSTTLSEICSMQNGYAFKSNEWTENGIPVIKIGSVKPMIVDIESNGFVAEENEFSRSDFLLTAGDIVVGLTGYVGEVGRIPYGDKAMLNQRVAKFIPKKLEGYLSYYNFVYCLARQKTFKEYAELNAKGSAQANISTKELLNYPICIGTKKNHLLFEKQVNSMLEQILTNSQENKSLSKTRDLLLPKLLNGEI